MFSDSIIPTYILIFNVYHPAVVIILVFYSVKLISKSKFEMYLKFQAGVTMFQFIYNPSS